MLKLLHLVCTCFVLIQLAAAQTANTDNKTPITFVAGTYEAVVDEHSALYNGPEHVDYDARTVGSPYYQTLDWMKGTVYSKGIVYKNVPVKYDQVKDKLVVQHHNGFYKIDMISENIDSFSVAGRSFLYLTKSQYPFLPKTGFYDVLQSPALTLMIRRESRIVETIESMEVKRRVEAKDLYFVLKDGKSYTINKQGALLSLMDNKRREIQQHLKRNGLRFRKNKEQAITTAVQYYNQLNQAN